MSIKILEGKSLSYKIQSDLKKKIYQLTNKPGLAVVIVGDDPASQIYVENKIRACREIGFYSEKITLPATTSKERIFSVTEKFYPMKSAMNELPRSKLRGIQR